MAVCLSYAISVWLTARRKRVAQMMAHLTAVNSPP